MWRHLSLFANFETFNFLSVPFQPTFQPSVAGEAENDNEFDSAPGRGFVKK